MNKKRAENILRILKKRYPNAKIVLNYSNNFELLIAVMLSAQTTDAQVNKVTAVVFPKYRKENKKISKYYFRYKNLNISKSELIEIVNFAYSDLKKLENDIKSIGLFRSKAKNIRTAARILLDEYRGHVPKTIAELVKLPGVGRKTANVFLGNAYGLVEGIAVDTHVKRLSLKYGFTKNTNPKKIEKDLMTLFPKKDWFALTYLLIEHGRYIRKRGEDFIPHLISSSKT